MDTAFEEQAPRQKEAYARGFHDFCLLLAHVAVLAGLLNTIDPGPHPLSKNLLTLGIIFGVLSRAFPYSLTRRVHDVVLSSTVSRVREEVQAQHDQRKVDVVATERRNRMRIFPGRLEVNRRAQSWSEDQWRLALSEACVRTQVWSRLRDAVLTALALVLVFVTWNGVDVASWGLLACLVCFVAWRAPMLADDVSTAVALLREGWSPQEVAMSFLDRGHDRTEKLMRRACKKAKVPTLTPDFWAAAYERRSQSTHPNPQGLPN